MIERRTHPFCGLALLLASCGSASGATSASDTAAKGFRVDPPELWSGYDGTHAYQAPVSALANTGPVTWTVDDSNLVLLDSSAEPDGTRLMLTATKPGRTVLHASDGTHSADAPLEIYAYTSDQYNAGEARYTHGPNIDNPACNDCHNARNKTVITPTELDGAPDEQLQAAFLSGEDPQGRAIDYAGTYKSILNGKKHEWNVSAAEKVGLSAYLRALPPAANGSAR